MPKPPRTKKKKKQKERTEEDSSAINGEKAVEVEGTVLEALPNAMFKVQLENDFTVLALFVPYNALYALMFLSLLMVITTGNCVVAKVLQKAPWNRESVPMGQSCDLASRPETPESEEMSDSLKKAA